MQKANIELEALQSLFKSAWQFLKTTPVTTSLGAQTTLAELPWYLVIGPTAAGKSQLIIQSGLKIIPTQNFAIDPADEDEDQHRCNWWCTKEATFIDVPGSYLPTAEAGNSVTLHWQQFLTILLPYLKRKPLVGIILTLSLPDWWLQTKTEQKNLAQCLREAIHLLATQLHTPCPLYLVLTKTDQISGFKEFFADLGQEERNQVWGFNLNNNKKANTATSLPRLFKSQFDQLLKRLNVRLIWRLHHERNLQKRAAIQHFPLQMETLKNGLANLVYQLADVIALQQTTSLQGIYFVSSLQQGVPVDCLHKTLSETLALSPQLTALPIVSNKQQSYFSQQLFKQVLLTAPTIKVNKPNFSRQTKVRISAYISSVLLVMGSGLLMAHNFNTKVTNLNAAQAALAEYKITTQQLPLNDHDLNQTLPALNLMQQTNMLLMQINLPGLIPQTHDLPPLAAKTYHMALSDYFLPGLGSLLEQALVSTTDPNFLYGALKVYLMLGDPSHFDPVFIHAWLSNYWRQTLSGDPVLEQQMEGHLTALLALPVPPLELKQDVIAKTRATLNSMAPSLLAYAILKTQTDNSLINPFVSTTKQAQAFAQVFAQNKILVIPKLYTATAFQTVYFQQIKKTCAAVTYGDWVLGSNPNIALTANTEAGLVDQVKMLYLRDYTRQWQALLNNLQISDWQNWQQAKTSLHTLLSSHSPLLDILQTVSANTSLKQLMPANDIATNDVENIKINLADAFADINNSLQTADDTQASSLDQTMIVLNQLQNYLATINGDNAKAFTAAKTRFADNATIDPIEMLFSTAKNMPQPLQGWLTALANNSWHMILASTDEYLNTNWQTQVFPLYKLHLDNRYPLFKNAQADANLAEFVRFFAPNQALDSYFKNYLAPFMDTSQAQWRWRIVDGQSLNLSPLLLAQLERAAIIRTMFFDDNNKLNVQFSLQPIAMEQGVTSLTLLVNGQRIVDQPDAAGSHNLAWPNNINSPAVTLMLTDNQGRQMSNTEEGPWALFHLLDKANLQPTNNTQNFLLTFDINGNSARYQLLADKLINPFIPGILDQFRCPESLN